MDTKQKVLEQLERSRGLYVSGEQIAQRLGLSRNMIWRAITALRADGHRIEAVTNKGYRLAGSDDKLTLPAIRAHLWDPALAERIELHQLVESTNRLGRERAFQAETPLHGAVILADAQSAGRGRRGRYFFSPAGSGLYMSVVLDPARLGFGTPTAITAHAAICVCEAVESVCGLELGIKWVNDILLDDKKVGGILTEALTDFESGAIHGLVLGVGLNITTRTEDFPEELRATAGSLDPDRVRNISRSRLAAEIVNRFCAPATGEGEAALFARYRQRLTMLGSRVTVRSGAEPPYTATALDIDEAGCLVVETAAGERQHLAAGEISIRVSDD